MLTSLYSDKVYHINSFDFCYQIAEKDFYKRLKSHPNTIICIQYNTKEFLIFPIHKVQSGKIIYSDNKAMGLQCWINHKCYIFIREHLNQMSHREQQDLFNFLGVDGSQLLQD